jgi:hypothetical protein
MIALIFTLALAIWSVAQRFRALAAVEKEAAGAAAARCFGLGRHVSLPFPCWAPWQGKYLPCQPEQGTWCNSLIS